MIDVMNGFAELIRGWGYVIDTVGYDYVIVHDDKDMVHMVEIKDGVFYVDTIEYVSRTHILFEVPLADPDSFDKLRERLLLYG